MPRLKKIVFQGEPGANSHLACQEVYPDYEAVPCPTFEDCFAAVEKGDGRARHDPDREFARRPRRRHPPPAADLRPPHHRRALPADPFPAHGAEGRDAQGHSQSVHSQIHALGQCRKIIRAHGWTAVVEGDTAGAAREVAERGDPTRAALAPRLAAELYGLDDPQGRRRGRGPQHDPLHHPVEEGPSAPRRTTGR